MKLITLGFLFAASFIITVNSFTMEVDGEKNSDEYRVALFADDANGK